MRDHGSGVGVEAQILQYGDLVIARTFPLREMAQAWANRERQRVEAGTHDDTP